MLALQKKRMLALAKFRVRGLLGGRRLPADHVTVAHMGLAVMGL